MGFNNSSWGRTRGPKNLVGGVPGAKVTPLGNTNFLKRSATDYKTEGYLTENQRHLHVLIEDAHGTAPAATTIFGYCHAFERWFEIPQSQAAGGGANTALTAASISIADSGVAVASQTPSDREYRVYEILGIDRIAFVHEDSSEVSIFAACSTF
jgi:hypothetical protein